MAGTFFPQSGSGLGKIAASLPPKPTKQMIKSAEAAKTTGGKGADTFNKQPVKDLGGAKWGK